MLQDDVDMADWEEAAGISAPLYEIVDTVFELQSRGFFRRQVSKNPPHEALWRRRCGAEQGRACRLGLPICAPLRISCLHRYLGWPGRCGL